MVRMDFFEFMIVDECCGCRHHYMTKITIELLKKVSNVTTIRLVYMNLYVVDVVCKTPALYIYIAFGRNR